MTEAKMPWDREGETFDEDKARKWIADLVGDKEKLQERLSKATSSSKGKAGEAEDLRKENLQLKVQIHTGLDDRQIARLVGNTFEEVMEDAAAYAEETGIELRSLIEEDDAGTQDQDDSGAAPEGQTKSVERNYRNPGQQVIQEAEVDLSEIAAGLDVY